MAYADTRAARGTTGFAALSARLSGLVTLARRQLEYRRTLNALAGLSDRELDDIGLSRGQIEAAARDSARAV